MTESPSQTIAGASASSPRRLESWKEVAAYLKRDVSTVRRWERREGLPIHRQAHASRDSIFAFTTEIESWLNSRDSRPRNIDRSEPAAAEHRNRGRRAWSTATISLAIAIALVLIGSAGLVEFDRSDRRPMTATVGPDNTATQANRFYLRGRQRMEARDREGFASAVTDFRAAVIRDPGFAKAYAGLADAHSLMGYYRFRPPREAFEDAKAAVSQALKLDDTLAEAHASLAGLLAYYDWDWSGAEREYRRAIQLDPSFAAAHHWYANCLSLMGRHDEAIAQARAAVDLQPLSLIILTGALGNSYVEAGRYEQAAEQFRSALDLDQKFANAHASLGLLYWRQGLLAEARQEMEAAVSLSDRPSWTAFLAALRAALGQRDEARRMLDVLQRQPDRLSPSALAAVYLQLGDREQALTILERGVDARDPDLPSVKTEPGLAGIRGEPRFEALLRRMHMS